MEENVALDSSKQKKFVKSIKGIKKLLQVKDKSPGLKNVVKDKIKDGKIKKPKRKQRGLVYLSHIPHGFYEHQMTEYFKQFGVVTNARVIRSKRTGMSKGHAFVEFKDPTVAEIVAETMNNYLMGKRLIKAALIPPEKQRRNAKRKHWNAQYNPGTNSRQLMKKKHNEEKTKDEDLSIARRLLSNLSKTKEKLRDLDIDYSFFMPVDMPEELANEVEIKSEEDNKSKATKKEKKSEDKIKKEEITQTKNKKNKSGTAEVKVEDAKIQKPTEKPADKKTKKGKETQKTNISKVDTAVSKADKKVVKEKVDAKQLAKDKKASKTQEQKVKKLKDAGVTPPENFIKIQNKSDESSDDSSMDYDSDEYEMMAQAKSGKQSASESDEDGSMEFDSDEYEKAINDDDSDVESESEIDEELDDNITSEEESVVDIPPPKKVKGPVMQNIQPKGQANKQKNKPKGNKKQAPQPIVKLSPKKPEPSKKPKFEKKGNQKTLKKVIKKKK